MIDAESLRDVWRSERLVYRYVEDNEEDAAFVYSLSADPTVMGLSSPQLLRPPTMKSTKKLMESFLHSPNTIWSAVMCLPPAQEGENLKPIGLINLFRTMSETEFHRNAIIGVSVVEDYRGKGYGREAIDFILDFAFRRANLHRVGIKVYSYNQIAYNLYKKIGFVEEGREREVHFFDRQYHDIISLSMLEHEWAALRGLHA